VITSIKLVKPALVTTSINLQSNLLYNLIEVITNAGLTKLIEVVTKAGLTNLIEVVTKAGLTVTYLL
jgi:hypothetical protein